MESKSQTQAIQKNRPKNSNVCFLCGREGHYGSPTSCYAANKVEQHKNKLTTNT
jgi:hypothetical protein